MFIDLNSSEDRSRIQTVCLAVIAIILITFSIYWLRPVLVPLVLAIFVVSGVTPLVDRIENRLHVNRLVAAAVTFVIGVVVILFFGIAIWTSLVDLSHNGPAYRARVQEIANQIEDPLSKLLPPRPADRETSSSLARELEPTNKHDISDLIDIFVRDGISILSQAMLSLISTSAVVLIYVFFLSIGSSSSNALNETFEEINDQIRSYLSLKTVISIFTGLAFGMTLNVFGVPMAFTFGVLAFLLNFVPNIGPIVASLLPIPLILLDPSGSALWMVSVILATSLIQLVSGNIVEPKLMGSSSDLHPVTILMALVFWGMMWGIIGMFLATPITSVMRILLQRIEPIKPLTELMAGRWPVPQTVQNA